MKQQNKNNENKNNNLRNNNHINIKLDSSLYNRFHEAVKILATQTGSLNKRLFDCYNYYLFPFQCEHFEEKELQERFEYVVKIMSNPNKCFHYKGLSVGRLHCHWKESKKIAENIFYIYNYIVNAK